MRSHQRIHSTIVLTERPGARRKLSGTVGLYHVAIRFPSRRALAQAFQGFADHLVSEALYLADPDGNGLELYVDRPQEQWQQREGQIVMATDPLDVEALLAEVGEDGRPWTGVHPETDIGHVHLHVSDLVEQPQGGEAGSAFLIRDPAGNGIALQFEKLRGDKKN